MKYLFEEAKILLEKDLDSKFFDDDNNLKPEVRQVLLDVADDVLKALKNKGFDLKPAFIILTGSLTGYNWDEFSDVDFHIGVDFNKFTNPERTKQFLQLFARDWNSKSFHLIRRSLELYFQDANEPHDSPGIYDITVNHWIKIPEGVKIDITDEMKSAADNYKFIVDAMVAQYKSMPKNRTIIKEFQEKLATFFESIRHMRKTSIKVDGRAGFGNQVFKMLRRNNTLEALSDLIRKVQDDYYDVEWD